MIFSFENRDSLEAVYFRDSVYECLAYDYGRWEVRLDMRQASCAICASETR